MLLTTLSLVAQENNSLGDWETITTEGSPLARHESSFVNVGGKFYLLGGRGIKPVSIYNYKTNTWSEGAAPPMEIHHFQAVSFKKRIYIIGAMTGGFPHETPLTNVMIYDPKMDKWKEGAEIPEERRRGSGGLIVKKNSAYVVSGIVDGHWGTHVPWVDRYDFKTDTWTVLTDAPRSRDHFHAAMKKGKIYCAGGRNSSTGTQQTFQLTIAEVDVYDIKTNTWITLPAKNNIPTKRAGTSSVFIKNNLIIIGGESGELDTAHEDVEAYNVKTKEWTKISSLQRGRHGTQAILYKKKIFIVAGSGSRGGSPELSSLEKFD